ncbi:MAG: hypothetical protein KY445_02570 [Armatimonadetes bacterium]|nr:hypothetical protein [Armatimonadota bacterium]
MKNQNWMILAALVAGGTAISSVPATAKNEREDRKERKEERKERKEGRKTERNERRDDKNDSTRAGDVKSQQVVSLNGQTIVVNGQTFRLSGSVNVRFSVKQRNDGAQIKAQVNPQGATVTAPDGTVFRLVGASNTQARTNSDGTTFRTGANFGLIGQGKAPNFRLHLNLKGSVSPTGVVTLTKSDVEVR